MFRIALRAALKVRAQRSMTESLIDDERASAPEPALEARDEARRMAAAIAVLPVEHRAVISLSALDGVSHLEIAEILGIPAGTVASRMHGARKKLLAVLAEPNARARVKEVLAP